jgi:threonine efflux protein
MLNALLTIFVLYAGALVSPGPNILLVSQLAASSGHRTAVLAALGIAAGAGLWATAVVLGLPALFAAVPGLRNVMQLAGGAYLLYLATRLWRSGIASAGEGPSGLRALAALRLGTLTNLTNPKAVLFFGSVFAAALPPAPTAALKSATVALVISSAAGWYGLLAILFSRATVREAYARRARLFGRIAAVVLGGLAAALLWDGLQGLALQ